MAAKGSMKEDHRTRWHGKAERVVVQSNKVVQYVAQTRAGIIAVASRDYT